MTCYAFTHARTTLRASTDVIVGLGTAAYGSTGAAVRWFTEIGDALTIGTNLIIAVGGILLLYHRLKLIKLEREHVQAKIQRHQKETTDEC